MTNVAKRLLPAMSLGPAAILIAASAGLAQVAQAQSTRTEVSTPAAGKRILFALIYRPGPNWRPGKPFREQIAIKEHYAYMKALFASGQIFSAGGMGTENGLVLFHARDQAEAEAVLTGDPMVQAGGFAGDVRPYSPAFLSDGQLTVTKD